MASSSAVDVELGQSSVRLGIAPTARGWAPLLAIACVSTVAAVSPSAAAIALDVSLAVVSRRSIVHRSDVSIALRASSCGAFWTPFAAKRRVCPARSRHSWRRVGVVLFDWD